MSSTPPADSPAQLLPRYALTEVMHNQASYDRPVCRLRRLFEQESFQLLLDQRLWRFIKTWNVRVQFKELREQLGRYIPDADELVADVRVGHIPGHRQSRSPIHHCAQEMRQVTS